MDEETNTLIAKWYLAKSFYGTLSVRDFSDWAVTRIEQGKDSKNICILASMYDAQSYFDIEDYFYRSLQELGWNFPNKEECLERYAKFIAQKIVDGEIEPFQGCAIMREINNSLGHPANLSHWISLYWAGDDLDLEGQILTNEEFNKRIIQEAKRYLSGEIFIYPESIEEKVPFENDETNNNFFSKLLKKLSK